MTVYAGQFGPESLEYPDGTHAVNKAVRVYLEDGETLASLYTDRDKTVAASNPVSTNNLGNLIFWANPGNYFCEIGGFWFEAQVNRDPEEPGSSVNGFTHVQSTPSASWIIPNQLGNFPGSVVLVVDDEEVESDVSFPDETQISITHAFPVAGRAEIRG